MKNRTRSGRLMCACLCVLAILGATACGDKKKDKAKADPDKPGVWFVHATDPHIFIPAATEPSDNDPKVVAAKAAAEKQQEKNEKAFSDMLKRGSSVPEGDGPPAFLVLTGDLGVDPCPIPADGAAQTPAGSGNTCVANVDKAQRQKQIEKLASLFGASPLKDIYLVAGNNDIATEDPGDDALLYFNELLDKVQEEIKSNVRLHNLTRCYSAKGGDPSSCAADVAGTQYRLVGFPSYSFRNEKPKAGDLKTQEKQFDIFRGLLDAARTSGKKVVVLSHVPEIDDPFALGQDRYNGIQPAKSNDTDEKNARSQWSTWNVSKKLLDDWYAALASDSVEAVMAGHLHDSHQEVYQPPYSWSTPTSQRGGFQKLFLAPPLSVKNQDDSPIQARGFSLIHLDADRVRPRLYWYNSEAGDFKAEARRDFEGEQQRQGGWHWPRFVKWVWGLDSSDTSLARWAVLSIAFLTAFLTVVAIWQIPPPPDNLLADATGKPKDKKDKKETPPDAENSPFSTRIGKTVLAGLGGLVMTEVTKTLGDGKPSADLRWFYIAWFILFFFALLLLLNLFRASTEGVRARVAVVYYPPPRIAPPAHHKRKYDPLSYWIWRFFRWLASLRVPVLTMADSFINLIQGKNQTMTKALADRVVGQQRTIVRVADAIRKDLNDLIDRRVFERGCQRKVLKQKHSEQTVFDGNVIEETVIEEVFEEQTGTSPKIPHHVRVNISVLSTDQTNVFYISRTPGSSRNPFSKRSMAWVAVFTGSIRWFLEDYLHLKNQKQIVLFDNSKQDIADDERMIMLNTHYQDRPGQDYEAFMILPVPWPKRGFGTDYVKGAIHISFSDNLDFKAIWPGIQDDCWVPDKTDDKRVLYPSTSKILEDWCDAEVRTALHTSMKALGELLHGFDEEIYRNFIEPTQID